MKKLFVLILIGLGFLNSNLNAAGDDFVIFDEAIKVTIVYDAADFTVVKKSAEFLAQDIELVTGFKPVVVNQIENTSGYVILVGSLTQSKIIQSLAEKKLVNKDTLAGKWESWATQVLENPFESIEKALVIYGSDRRGTAYGVFDISEKIGVSPWYWWADVTPEKKEKVVLSKMNFVSGPPSVKYRGIFLNDEDWGLQPWAAKTVEPETGDIGPKTYAKIFELLLRLKANLIWPAMHNCTKAFYHYPENRKVADDFAIVVGSSHTEPMLRNNDDEWDPGKMGEYNYKQNEKNVYNYWEKRAIQSKNYENIYTVGMRGIGDSGIRGMSSMEERVKFIGKIIQDQRKIIRENITKAVTSVPQAFIPYKEVLEIYDAGLKLPDDVTIVWPDDNYGYIRRLNNAQEMQRSGGSGIYYHLSYWGRPHDYLWLSTTHSSLIREEMMKAFQTNAKNMWVFNVGDIKPAEHNLSFCLDMAWSVEPFSRSGMEQFYLWRWLSSIFGRELARPLAETLWEYYDLAFERRPEFMGWSQTEPTRRTNPTEYNHFENGDEAQKRLDRYDKIAAKVEELKSQVPERLGDAYYELIYYPVICAAAMNEKFLCLEKANYYARQSRASANDYAKMAELAYDKIVKETGYYNIKLAGGKWQHMMSKKPRNLPVFQEPLIPQWEVPDDSSWGLCAEGFGEENPVPDVYAGRSGLPQFNRWTKRKYFVDIFMKGQKPVTWQARPTESWIKAEPASGVLTGKFGEKEQRVWVSINWDKVPANTNVRGAVRFEAAGQRLGIGVSASNIEIDALDGFSGFIEDNRVISIFAENASCNISLANSGWNVISGLGSTGNSIMAEPVVNPVKIDLKQLVGNVALAEYDFFTFSKGKAKLKIIGLPAHPLNEEFSLRFAVAVDDQPPQIFDFKTFGRSEEWKLNVLSNTAQVATEIDLPKKGRHVLKIYAVDPGVILDRMIIDFGGLEKGYSVVPETKFSCFGK